MEHFALNQNQNQMETISINSHIGKCYSNIKFFIIAIIVIPGLVIIFLLITPIFLYRWTVCKLKYLFRKDLYKIVPAFGAMFLQSKIENEEKTNLMATYKLQGKVDPVEFSRRISEIFLNSKEPNGTGKLKYPEFQMYAEYWLGYPFWKSETNFRLEDHFRREELEIQIQPEDLENPKHDDGISKYEYNLLKKPFKSGKSPWEIMLIDCVCVCVVENRREYKYSYYLLVKFHHSLGDGFSLFHSLMQLSDNYSPMYIPLRISTTGVMSKCWNFLKYPFQLARDIAELSRDINVGSDHPWNLSMAEMPRDVRIIAKSNLISCDKIKIVRVKHTVSFTAVLLASVAGGFHNFLNKIKQPTPVHIMMGYPLPLQNKHSEGLTNHYASIFFRLPVGDPDRLSRLRKCEQEIRNIKKSKIPGLSIFIYKASGSFPHCILSKIRPAKNGILQCSNFPGPTNKVTVLGQPISDMYFNVWGANFQAICLTILTYNGRIRIVLNGTPKLFPSEELLQEFVDEITQEIENLTFM